MTISPRELTILLVIAALLFGWTLRRFRAARWIAAAALAGNLALPLLPEPYRLAAVVLLGVGVAVGLTTLWYPRTKPNRSP